MLIFPLGGGILLYVTTREFLASRRDKALKGKEHNQILPQLNNCNMIANHWARELMTIFDHTCVKDWRPNQHLRVRTCQSMKYRLEYSLVISSSKDILSDEAKTFAPDTLILVGTATIDECSITFWGKRHLATPVYIIRKNNADSFILIEDGVEKIRQYRKFRTESGNKNLTKLGRFVSNSLVALCLQKTCSKGAKISNKNSDVQSARKKGKLVKGSKVFLFGNDIIGFKTMKGAYEFVAGEYGYKKSYRSFVRELKKGGEANVIEFKKNNDILRVSLMGI
jgi:hypothetical protein